MWAGIICDNLIGPYVLREYLKSHSLLQFLNVHITALLLDVLLQFVETCCTCLVELHPTFQDQFVSIFTLHITIAAFVIYLNPLGLIFMGPPESSRVLRLFKKIILLCKVGETNTRKRPFLQDTASLPAQMSKNLRSRRRVSFLINPLSRTVMCTTTICFVY